MKALLSSEDLTPLLHKDDLHEPRYTSYPTALQFNENFSEQDYQLQALSSNEFPIPKLLSVYMHFPFCKSLCYYCGWNKIITHKNQMQHDYLDDLYQEIEKL